MPNIIGRSLNRVTLGSNKNDTVDDSGLPMNRYFSDAYLLTHSLFCLVLISHSKNVKFARQ